MINFICYETRKVEISGNDLEERIKRASNIDELLSEQRIVERIESDNYYTNCSYYLEAKYKLGVIKERIRKILLIEGNR